MFVTPYTSFHVNKVENSTLHYKINEPLLKTGFYVEFPLKEFEHIYMCTYSAQKRKNKENRSIENQRELIK